MNTRMKVFADEWLTGEHTGKKFSVRDAADYAGYSTAGQNPYQVGSKVLRHPEVQAYIKKRLDDLSMSAAEVLLRFTEIARAEIGNVVKKNLATNRLEIDPDAVLENKKFIKNFGFDSNGNPKIDFHDSMQALRDIARVRGMLKDGLEVSGPGGAGIPVTMQVQFVSADGKPSDLNPPQPEDDNAEDFSDIESI